MAKQKSNSKSGAKKQGKNGSKRGPKRLEKTPIYKAIFGGRAKIVPSMKYSRDTKKAKSFEKIVSLVRVNQDVTRTVLEREGSHNCAMNMCKRHGIDMADALEQIEFSKNKYQASQSTVIIKHSNKNKRTHVRTQTFLVDLCDAIEMMFHCDAYTELKNGVLRVTFYGIASNTISAQLAFKTCYNQVTGLGMNYSGLGPRNSFLLGISSGFWDRATRRKLAFEEDLKRAKEMAATTFANEDFEADSDYHPDFDFDIESSQNGVFGMSQVEIKTETPEDNSMALVRLADKDDEGDDNDDEESDSDDGCPEGSYNWVQRILAHNDYREKVEQTAASWLKEKGIKLRAHHKRKRNIRFPVEFAQGEEDSLDIDLGEKRIEFILQQDLGTENNGEGNEEDEESD